MSYFGGEKNNIALEFSKACFLLFFLGLQVMTSVSVPSTLVKCLYLFFDLPEIENADTPETGSEFTPRERRILLQKIFVQVTILISQCVNNVL